MAELKTRATEIQVADFIAAVPDATRRADAGAVCTMMTRLTGEPPKMWGPSIIGFGRYAYRYDSGRTGEMCRIGFSPRKAELVLYVLDGNADQSEVLGRLGRHRTGKAACTSSGWPMWTRTCSRRSSAPRSRGWTPPTRPDRPGAASPCAARAGFAPPRPYSRG